MQENQRLEEELWRGSKSHQRCGPPEFSDEWRAVLGNYHLKTFHAADCQNFRGEFIEWKGKEDKRLRLWCDLLGVIKKHTFHKFSVGMRSMIGKNLFPKKGKESQRSMPMCYVLWLVQNVSSYGLDGKMSKRPSHIFMSQVILGVVN
ncbi:MAG: hypothetical protein KF747_01915 [Nitrospira sp.]|nr:hypothetical protein [Nitrospira sp.]